MKLLYFKEHLSCMNYQVDVNTGFVCYNLEKDNVSQIDNSASPCIFFLLDGEVSIDSGEYQNVLLRKMKCFLSHSMWIIKSKSYMMQNVSCCFGIKTLECVIKFI